MNERQIRPIARSSNLVVERFSNETLVYDRVRHKAHCLNASAAYVWHRSTGRVTVDEIASGLPDAVGLPEDPRVTVLALQRLWSARLLDEPVAVEITHARVSRRGLMRDLVRTGVSVLVLPAVATILVPQPARAVSCAGLLQSCAGGRPCCPGLGLACVLNVCTNI